MASASGWGRSLMERLQGEVERRNADSFLKEFCHETEQE